MVVGVRMMIVVFVVFVANAASTGAQTFPNKAIRLVVPNAAGGGLDIVGRMLAAKMSESLGQPVVVDNKPGASTIIGTDLVAKAPADGHTIGLVTDSHSINPNFVAKLPFDSMRDFEPVTQLVDGYYVLVAHPGVGVKTVAQLIAAAKLQGGKFSYASAGLGSPHHLTMEWLRTLAGIEMNHVPYKGVAPAVADVMSGHVNALFSGPPTALPHVATGKLIGVAVTSPKRLSYAPNIPTVAESGFPEFIASFWYGLLAPPGTPKDVVSRLNREVLRVLALPDVRERLEVLGLEAVQSMTPDQFASFLKQDAAKYAKIIKTSGAKAE
ncbi:MAG: tripartite tricarboxylate transporter substrate binding protein [Burkholderiales bacterium]